jgi:type VI secretion system protein ImpH
MVVSFLGLTGPSGVLPRHYTELMLNRIRAKDFSLRDFFDLFNHRLISLFYRSWEKFRLPLGYERSRSDDPGGKPDLTTWALYCLVGLGTEGLRGRSSVDDRVSSTSAATSPTTPARRRPWRACSASTSGAPSASSTSRGQWLVLGRENQAMMPDRLHPRGGTTSSGST